MRPPASWYAAPPADAAIEIAPEAVSAAVVSYRGGDAAVQAYGVEPLPPGALTASLTGTNLVNRQAVAGALRTVLGALGARVRRVAVLLPDLTARVSLVRFDKVPARAEDLTQLVRWQVRKSAPFPIEEGQLTHAPCGRAADGASEFVAVLARRAVVREYESVCEEAGLDPGLVDLSTFGAVNLLLSTPSPPAGDWLVAHVRPEYVSLVIMRGSDMIFFRNVAGGDVETLADAAHQTAMYYQDRLSGTRFAQVLLGGFGRNPSVMETARRSLEERLGAPVRPFEAARAVALRDRITPSADLAAALAPLLGTLLRMRAGALV
jgi:type IV pilus assembly protein PilM